MNKILTYPVIAILLGTIIMIALLVVQKPNRQTLADKALFTTAETNTEELDRKSTFTRQEEPSASLEHQISLDSYTEEPAAYELLKTKKVSLLACSQLGMMIVPGFLFGLDVFVCLKKRILWCSNLWYSMF